MKLKLIHLGSTDVENLETADLGDDFYFLLRALVGLEDEPSEESFDFLVVSPKRLASMVRESGPMFGRFLIIVEKFDYGKVRDFILQYMNTCEAETYSEAAGKLARVSIWEFEDYQETPPDVMSK